MRKNCLILTILLLFLFNTTSAMASYSYGYQAEGSRKETRYDYLYMNPPRQSLGAYGRYVMGSSAVRYVHSPSKLKREHHAERINAYNMAYAYGY